jgi:hypothetical protein
MQWPVRLHKGAALSGVSSVERAVSDEATIS